MHLFSNCSTGIFVKCFCHCALQHYNFYLELKRCQQRFFSASHTYEEMEEIDFPGPKGEFHQLLNSFLHILIVIK